MTDSLGDGVKQELPVELVPPGTECPSCGNKIRHVHPEFTGGTCYCGQQYVWMEPQAMADFDTVPTEQVTLGEGHDDL